MTKRATATSKGSSADLESSKTSQPKDFARFGLTASGAPPTLKQLLESTRELNIARGHLSIHHCSLSVIIVSCSWPVAVAIARHSPSRLLSYLGNHQCCNKSRRTTIPARVLTPLSESSQLFTFASIACLCSSVTHHRHVQRWSHIMIGNRE